MSRYRINWRGRQILSRMERAQRDGLNETMSEAVQFAKSNHQWRNRTGTLEGSINIATFAEKPPGGSGFRGEWGSKDVVYAIVHELGSPKLNIPPRPYLRPAADAQYPSLNGNIRAQFRRSRQV